MTRVIASLVELGLVVRTAHPTDGRQVIVSLSPAGQTLIADEASAREAWMTAQLSGLSETQLTVLRDAVDIIGALVSDSE